MKRSDNTSNIPCSYPQGPQSSPDEMSERVILHDLQDVINKYSRIHPPAIYLAVSESTLATRAVKDGFPSEFKAGWITSAPRIQSAEQGE
jgi:hypothetical protein